MTNNQQVSTPRVLKDIFSSLNEKVGFVRLNEISPGLGDRAIKLLDLVVPLRSDISVSALIDDNGLNSVYLHRIGKTTKPLGIINEMNLSADVFYESGTHTSPIRINRDFTASLFNAVRNILVGQNMTGLSLRQRSLILSPLWAEGEKVEFADIDVLSAANIFQYVVILGAPGSGKTTTARAIATAHYQEFIDSSQNRDVTSLGLWNDPYNLPIYIELKTMVSDMAFPPIGSNPNADFFREYIKRNLYNSNGITMDYVLDKLQNGEVVLVLDGLDEVPIPSIQGDAIEARHNQLQNLIRSIKTVFPKIKIVVTSRPAGYSGWTLENFEVIHIRPLSSAEATRLAYTYYIAAGEDALESKQLTQRLVSEIERLPLKIREYPLFICLLASIYRDKRENFPAKRGGLLQVSLNTLLDTWTMKRYEGKSLQDILNCTPDQIMNCLAQISFRALSEIGISKNTDTPDLPISMVLEEFYMLGDHINPTQVLNYIMNQAGIWTSPAQRSLRFVHRLFQEYLAALAISQKNESIQEMINLVIQNPVLWSEVSLLFADILSNMKMSGELLLFIELLLKEMPKCASQEEIIALVANIIIEEEFHLLSISLRRSASIEFCKKTLEESLTQRRINLSGKQRYLIGLALNELGDPRAGISLDASGLPLFSWKSINAGNFLMGTNVDDVKSINEITSKGIWKLDRECPQHLVSMAAFEISKYPVTRQQFNAFVLAEDGYSNDQWWTTNGLVWRNNNCPPPTISSLPNNCPQNCVTWYEAVAFCHWYSYRTNRVVRLPTEAEWEYAARGSEAKYQFTWGNECDSVRANVNATGINTISPVGCFPTGIEDGEYVNLYDMNGNIWEWCSTIVEKDDGFIYRYPYNKDDGRENDNEGEHCLRATRGGYYGGEWMLARSCYRGRDIPSLRAERQGFRVVREME